MHAAILLDGVFQEAQPNPGISIWVWVLIILVLVLVLVWFMMRAARETPTVTPHEEHVTPITVATSTAPDDLVILEGIGPKIADILIASGIATFDQLAAADVTRLQEILAKEGLGFIDPHSWPEQARLAAAGDQAGLKALQDRLKGGRAV